MKPCPPHQKPIAWLALDVLDSESTRSLRAHLEICPACRQQLEEMSALTKSLDALRILSEVQASSAFHQKLMHRLEAEAPVSLWESLPAQLQQNWRVALPVTAAAVVVLAVFLSPRPGVTPSAPALAPVAMTASAPTELPPTVANYQRVANQSFEEFNDLLTRQGTQNLSSAPVYTAGTGFSAL